jgi:hypothetical protein
VSLPLSPDIAFGWPSAIALRALRTPLRYDRLEASHVGVCAATTVEEVYPSGGKGAFSLLRGPDVLRGSCNTLHVRLAFWALALHEP